jgi:hypothetical protein
VAIDKEAACGDPGGGGGGGGGSNAPELTTPPIVPPVVDAVTPEDLFEGPWALALLEGVMSRLQKEYFTSGKGEQGSFFGSLCKGMQEMFDPVGNLPRGRKVIR